MQFRSNQFNIPEVTKNIIIINVLLFLATLALPRIGINLTELFGMFYFESNHFKIWQPLTHVFMHGSFMHILFNMWGVWMFGARLEQMWGPKRFLNFYLITAAGAFLLHFLIVYFQIQQVLPHVSAEDLQMVLNEGRGIIREGNNYKGYLGNLNAFLNVPVVGASGALFGILVAFAMYWPNTELYIMFIPMPIKAKYAVLGYAAFELFSGISGFMPGIAHFAHLGGALFGFLLVKYWNRNNRSTLY